MTDQATRVVPAGWYEDPASPAHVRWWNGLAWTEHTAAKPTARPEPVAQGHAVGRHAESGQHAESAERAESAEHSEYGQHAEYGRHADQAQAGSWYTTPESEAESSRIAQARDLEREFGISTSENEVIHDGADQRAVDEAYRAEWGAEDEEDEEPPTATASSWLIALWPVFTLAATALAAYLYFYVTPQLYLLGLAAVPYLLTLLWAVTDARRLRRLGHRPAGAAFALLGPLVYLVARRVRVPGSGPLVGFLVVLAIVAGLPAAAYLTDSARPVTTALEIQQTVSAELVGSGQVTGVNCPFFVEDLTPGTLYTCTATLPNGASTVVWVSIDDEDGKFSYALSAR